MNSQNHGKSPSQRPYPREHMFSIRMNRQERDSVKALARQLNLPASSMARHFLLQAVDTINQQHEVTGHDPASRACQTHR